MFGYHGLTIGILAEELTWRVSGETLSEIYERDVRAERAIDFYLGLPESMEHRFRPVRPTPRATTAAAGTRPLDSLADLMGNLSSSNQTLLTSPASPNLRAIRAAGPAAIGGVGTATGLANVYAAAIGSVDGRAPLLSPETIAAISQEQVWGEDRLLGVEMSFAILFMKANRRFDFGSHLAFGHDGAGGAIGFADPRYGLGFGYIPNPMQPPGGADFKGTQLARVLRECAAHVRSK
jgi:CubicO group peptidase (beta-lactamase class C family)